MTDAASACGLPRRGPGPRARRRRRRRGGDERALVARRRGDRGGRPREPAPARPAARRIGRRRREPAGRRARPRQADRRGRARTTSRRSSRTVSTARVRPRGRRPRARRARARSQPLADVDGYLAFVERHNPRAWLTISAFGLTGRAGGRRRDRAHGRGRERDARRGARRAHRAAAQARGPAVAAQHRPGRRRSPRATPSTSPRTGGRCTSTSPRSRRRSRWARCSRSAACCSNTGSVGGAKRYGAPASFYRVHRRARPHLGDGGPPVAGRRRGDGLAGVGRAVRHRGGAHRRAPTRSTSTSPRGRATRTKQEAETLLQAHGVPATAVYSPAEILESPQLAHRDAFEPLPLERRARGAGRRPAVPRRRRRRTTPTRAPARDRCAACGCSRRAACSRFRSPARSSARSAPRSPSSRTCRASTCTAGAVRTSTARPGTERSAYFALMNHSKRSAAFDVDADRERLDELLADADVVIENLGPKRALGAGARRVGRAGRPPGSCWRSARRASGRTDRTPTYRAYAYNLQASCALGYLTRNRRRRERRDRHRVGRPHLRLRARDDHRGVGGRARRATPARASTSRWPTWSSPTSTSSSPRPASTPDDRRDRRSANELAPYAPNGVYPTADGWLALVGRRRRRVRPAREGARHDALLAAPFASASTGRERDALDRSAAATPTVVGRARGRAAGVGVAAEVVLDAERPRRRRAARGSRVLRAGRAPRVGRAPARRPPVATVRRAADAARPPPLLGASGVTRSARTEPTDR